MKLNEDLKMQINYYNSNFDLPLEVCTKPSPLIGFSGLDILNNAIHKAIWEGFTTNRRAERSPILFKLIGNVYEFPVTKPKRTSYDWYIPKGILKRNWMNKHINEIPAVMVIFYELNWNDPQWNEKMIECASRVQSMRAALEGRSTLITVVLIQDTQPMPAGEDTIAPDLAASLCASCELNSNSLFILPHGDHLQGYIVRLENAFYEFAQKYYSDEMKIIRSHKDHLSKTTHQFLIVRHQFKLGLLSELKQDIHLAHKHYTHAYNSLLEMRIVDTNALEIRTIAGFINYKLCRLMFSLNLPRDSISQFKAHIDRFRNRMGFQELSFEHYAWLSKQYSVFGDIFDEAVKLGLPAVQTQHPGIYYQQAAQFAIIRKQTCQELCSNIIAYPQPDPLEGINHMEFYGQRPWRPGKLSAEPPDPQIESNGIQAVQYLEKQVTHSNIIIALYGLAISQYKTYRCPRTRRHLILQMADEYYNSNDYGKALTLLTHMLCDFRIEGWWLLLSSILEQAIRCAFLTANIQDYLLLSLEILGKSSILDLEYKKRIHENLKRILKVIKILRTIQLRKQIPFGDNKLSNDVLSNGIIQWQPIFTMEPINIELDMTNIASCIETKARFLKNEYEIDQNVIVEIYVRCTCPLPLTFSRISVMINTPNLTQEFAVNNCDLEFENNKVKRFVIEFLSDINDVQKTIQIGTVNLTMGKPEEVQLNLKFSNTNQLTNQINSELLHFKYSNDEFDFDNLKSITTALIVPRHSKLDIKFCHLEPALVGEWYEIQIEINNKEDYNIKDLNIDINLTLDDTNKDSTEFSSNSSGIPENLPIVLKKPELLQQNCKHYVPFYLRAHKIGKRIIELKINYVLDKDKPMISIKNEMITIPVVMPFEIKTNFFSNLMNEIKLFYVGEEFCLIPEIISLSPWPLIIESTSFEFFTPLKAVENSTVKIVRNLKLQTNEIASEMFLGVSEKISEQNLILGHYTIKWKRQSGFSTTSQLTITGLPCEWIALELSLSVAAYGIVRTPLLVCYSLYNKSDEFIQLEVSLESSEAFMYAGYKQMTVSILPESVRIIRYNLYPLISGNVELPKLNLIVSENCIENTVLTEEQIKLLIKRSVPTHIYVMPQMKGNPQLTDKIKPKKLANLQ